jgi:hypothetical protein
MPKEQRLQMGERARKRALRFHTAAVRAEQLEAYVLASLEETAYSKKQGAAIKASPSPALL